MCAATAAASVAIDVVDAHWHPDRMTETYAKQGRLATYLLADMRTPWVPVWLMGGVVVYCDKGMSPSDIQDPGWVNAKGLHPSSVEPVDDLDLSAQTLVNACMACNWAIGEVELDYHRGSPLQHQAQRRFFAAVLGQRPVLLVIFHLSGTSQDPYCRQPLEDLLSLLDATQSPR